MLCASCIYSASHLTTDHNQEEKLEINFSKPNRSNKLPGMLVTLLFSTAAWIAVKCSLPEWEHWMYSSFSTQLWPSAWPPSPLPHYSQVFKGPLNMPQVAACHWVFNSPRVAYLGNQLPGEWSRQETSVRWWLSMRIWGCCPDISA